MRRLKLIGIFSCCLAVTLAPQRPLRAQSPDLNAYGPARVISNDDELKDVLTGLGYEPQKLKNGFVISIKQDTWTLNIQLVLSPDLTKLAMHANMGSVPLDSVSAFQWKTLLAVNRDISPSFFYYNDDNHSLYIQRALDNRAISPAYLKFQIDRFTANIKQTAPVWGFTH